MIRFMNWDVAARTLREITRLYTQDSLRKLTFDKTIYPLLLRFETGERSSELRDSIAEAEKNLLKDIHAANREECKGFFVNPSLKPSYTDIIQVVGKQVNIWGLIFNLLKDGLRLRPNLRFYEPLGWVVEFQKLKRIKMVLIPDKDSFKASIPSIKGICWNVKQSDDIRELYNIIYNHVDVPPGKYHLSEMLNALSGR